MDTNLNWKQLLSLLCSQKNKKCPLRLLDSIFLDSSSKNPVNWYFTTKSGTLSRKKGENSKITAIPDRFGRFSLANPSNTDGYVGVIVNDKRGTRRNLNNEELNNICNDNISNNDLYQSLSDSNSDTYLQVYLRPKNGKKSFLCLNYDNTSSSSSPSLNNNIEDKISYNSISDNGEIDSNSSSSSEFTLNQTNIFAVELIQYLETIQKFQVNKMSMEFVIDDNEHAWLSRIKNFNMSPISANSPPTDHENDNDKDIKEKDDVIIRESTDSLPSLRKNNNKNNSNKSDIDLLENGIQSSRNKLHDGPTPRTELVRKERGVYLSSLGPDELPGLRAWTLATLSENDQMGWAIDLNEYSSLPSPNSSLVDLRKRRAETRMVIPYRYVAFTRFAEELLLGRESIDNEDDFTTKWKTLLLKTSASDRDGGRLQSEVTVDGNLFGICRKLQALAETNFRALQSTDKYKKDKSPITLDEVNPDTHSNIDTSGLLLDRENDPNLNTSTTAVVPSSLSPSRPKSGTSSRAGSAMTDNDNSNSREIPRALSAGNDMSDLLEAGVPLTVVDAFREDGKKLSTGDVIGLNGVKKAKTGKKSNNNQKDKVDKNIDKIGLNNIAGVVESKVEKKKTFGKDSFEAPPSIEMIAKFAAEKEKYQKEQMQKQIKKIKQQKQQKDRHLQSQDEYLGTELELDSDDDNSNLNFQDKKKDKKSKKKKSKLSKAEQIKLEEERLEELEKLAAVQLGAIKNNQFQQPSSSDFNSNMNLNQELSLNGGLGGGSVISNVEADFMFRQAQHSHDVSQLSFDGMNGMPGNGFGHSAGDVYNNNTGTQHLSDKVTRALQERVDLLEKQNHKLNESLMLRNVEIEEAETKAQDLRVMLDNARQSAKQQLLDLEEDTDKKIRQLNADHAAEVAKLMLPPREPEPEPEPEPELVDPNDRKKKKKKGKEVVEEVNATPAPIDPATLTKHGANKLLIQQIEGLRADNQKQQEMHAIEMRRLRDEARAKYISTEGQLRGELSEAKAKSVVLEDNVHSLEESLTAEIAKYDNLAKMCKQLEKDRRDAVDSQAKLRADLTNMQQSVAASYRLETEQGMGVGLDADTAIKLHEAKSEAKERQLANKVEFLKAQLAAEQANTEELKGEANKSRFAVEELREEYKIRFKELQKQKEVDIAETERRVEQGYEERMTELTSLQAKMQLVQAQLQDAFQDGSLAKQREDAAKAATAKALANGAAMKNEIESLRSQVDELRTKHEDLLTKDNGRQSTEAMLRRLDNERQYLKSQLASEITHKGELQTTLTNVQQQLAEVQRQWKADVETLRDQQTKSNDQKVQSEQRTLQTTIQLESEVERLTKQCEDLKAAFTKQRDLLRAEQTALENMKGAGRRMHEELEAAREDFKRIRDDNEQDKERHSLQIEALTTNMEELEAKSKEESKHLREQISESFSKLAAAQREGLELTEKLDLEKLRQNKGLYVLKMMEILKRWRRARLFNYFRRWSTTGTLTAMATQFREQVDKMVDNMSNDAERDQEQALDDLRHELNAAEEIRIAKIHEEHEIEISNIRIENEDHVAMAIAEKDEEFKAIVAEKQDAWEVERELIIAQGKDNVESAIRRTELKIVEMEQKKDIEIKDLEFDLQKKLTDTVAVVKLQKDEEWAAKLQETKLSLGADKQRVTEEMIKEHLDNVSEIKKAHAQELDEAIKSESDKALTMLRDANDAADKAIISMKAKMTSDFQRQLEDLGDDHEDRLRSLRAEMHEASEERILTLKELWLKEKEDALLAKDGEISEIIEDKLAEQGRKHESDMSAVVKLEAAKWQQALKEAEKRFKLEAKQAHGEGWAARDRDARMEMSNLRSDLNAQADMLEQKHKDAAALMAKEHSEAMLALRNSLDTEKEREIARVVRETTHVVETEWSEKIKAKVDEAWAESADMWESKLKRETDKLESFKSDTQKNIQQMAEERNELLSRIASSDEILKSVEDLHKLESKRIEEKHQGVLNELQAKMEKMKSETVKDAELRAAEKLEQAENQFKEEMTAMLKLERERTTDNMEAQMKVERKESERLVGKLEKAIEQLKNDKSELAEQLEGISKKCEDTEDALYDAQVEQKKKLKESSINIWKLMTNMAIMRQRFEEGMQRFDDEAGEELLKVQKKAQSKLDNIMLTAMQFSGALSLAEKQRVKCHELLVGYKTDSLIEKRTQIKMLERELEILSHERDDLEEQRETMEEETSGLEAQVRELEEQIREHNRSSSMQNGRINVAHARKKRRLDSELERVLELIEKRRVQIFELDERIGERGRARDEKELGMIDLEKELVAILLEQQKKVLVLIEDSSFESKNKEIAAVANLPWPPMQNASIANVRKLRREHERREKMIEAGEDPDADEEEG